MQQALTDIYNKHEEEKDRLTLKITVLEAKKEEVDNFLAEKQKLTSELEELTLAKESDRAAANKRIGWAIISYRHIQHAQAL